MRAIRLPRLHVVTDTRVPAPGRPDPLTVVEAALAAGARLVQVRPEDHYTDRAAYDFAAAVAERCAEYGAVCLVNDRVHIAQAVGAHGVHLGADDLPLDAGRRLLPARAIIGGTCRDPESARAARRAGATYLGVGPVWGTTTKAGLPRPIGLDGLAAVCAAVDLPVIAIGGITAERAAQCRDAGAHGVAVVGAISAAADPAAATAELLAAVGETAVPTAPPRTWARADQGARSTAELAREDSAPDPATTAELLAAVGETTVTEVPSRTRADQGARSATESDREDSTLDRDAPAPTVRTGRTESSRPDLRSGRAALPAGDPRIDRDQPPPDPTGVLRGTGER
ncbi:thiamine phosphate synthase [Glycomyces terrestris]|uniref:Thiamine-phosphate synthase n=1 Tax=Glycomyces terrestris TaxID=2493553 RepID=A0A426V048_9ACTN|nr:thiamine phosphate synthase [Glycomyces terrestris]RRS00226.1 thiamine phosphate synthase [Glycomyces terrestris]